MEKTIAGDANAGGGAGRASQQLTRPDGNDEPKLQPWMTQKQVTDEWTTTNKSHDYLFGSSQKGQSNLTKLREVLVRHHLSRTDKNGRKRFKYVPLCSHHAVDDKCPNGPKCPHAHRAIRHLNYKKEENHLSGADAKKKIDAIFKQAQE